MKPRLKILMIDDSKTIRDSYEIVLYRLKDRYDIESDIVGTPDQALNRVNYSKHDPYDLACVDIELDCSYDKTITSGEDLAVRIKEIMPLCKIIIITNHERKERLAHIYNIVQPEGLLLKLQEGFDSICQAIQDVREGGTFYSSVSAKIINDLEKHKKDYRDILDKTDRKILYYLSLHYTQVEISHKINKSLSTVEKRKKKIKTALGLEDESDAELLIRARRLGYLNTFKEEE